MPSSRVWCCAAPTVRPTGPRCVTHADWWSHAAHGPIAWTDADRTARQHPMAHMHWGPGIQCSHIPASQTSVAAHAALMPPLHELVYGNFCVVCTAVPPSACPPARRRRPPAAPTHLGAGPGTRSGAVSAAFRALVSIREGLEQRPGGWVRHLGTSCSLGPMKPGRALSLPPIQPCSHPPSSIIHHCKNPRQPRL